MRKFVYSDQELKRDMCNKYNNELITHCAINREYQKDCISLHTKCIDDLCTIKSIN